MRNISDIIEHYLKNTIEKTKQEVIEVKRSELAEQFDCVPSQINYVIRTRFTMEKGYMVESKRGGGGYIRIIKVKAANQLALFDQLIELIGHGISQTAATNIVMRLFEEGAITKRESNIMQSALDREVLHIQLPFRDELRASILKAMLTTLKYKEHD
ncbi:CtsR family transcriptional regulator [Salipaludibacillus agaradhaerens]|uniref:CtsR family transcriptional regulator n=1 Tax=Salipaludibacillus agaradhaerens TaxID=76935 RepID=UPI002151FB8E|nr:CtsR family transcriptional regulator [Salipaludibacillus agaradhaerens]MCR6104787.1 CtsR family transcriptional regulator [Salipaludibacillus agaradhaerens]MCR6116835.1 CtsR family transcriptional regulator [Salipaludibacillus agaradhaerens]